MAAALARANSPSLPPLAKPLILLGLVAILFSIRLAAPADLMDFDQERPAAYALDAIKNSHWFWQRDASGALASKPPAYTWTVSLIAVGIGKLNRFALYAPCAISIFGIALCLWWMHAKVGSRAAWLAALIFLASPNSLKLVALARTDALFAFCVTVAALAAYRAWDSGHGWTWFWLAAAAATLTKGPLGLVLAAMGLLASTWEKFEGTPAPLRGSHTIGLVLFILITGGWFLLAYAQVGWPLFEKLVMQELVGHAVRNTKGHVIGQGFYKPALYFFPRFAPWSLFTALAIWRLLKNAPATPELRRFNRFLFFWFCGGLLIFSLSPHQRPDHLAPLVPAAALLAGQELQTFFSSFSDLKFTLTTALAALLLILAAAPLQQEFLQTNQALVEKTRGMESFAADIASKVGPEFPLTHVDTPFAFQFFLNTHRQNVSFGRAARLLQREIPAFVMVQNTPKLAAQSKPGAFPYRLAAWPSEGPAVISLLSNHPLLEWTEKNAVLVGPFFLQMTGFFPRNLGADQISLFTRTLPASVVVSNEMAHSQKLTLRVENPGSTLIVRTSLPPQGVWKYSVPSPR